MESSIVASETFEIDGFQIILDKNALSDYNKMAIKRGFWESEKRKLATKVMETSRRILECGTCIGLVSMKLAKIAGAENVFIYDTNPIPLGLAQLNFEQNELPLSLEDARLASGKNYATKNPMVSFYVNNGAVIPSNTTLHRNKNKISVLVRCNENKCARQKCNLLFVDIEGAATDLLNGDDLNAVNKIAMETHNHKIRRKKINDTICCLLNKELNFDSTLTDHEIVFLYKEAP
ncbi:hypothetical protein ACFQS7_11465 [Dankookia sp. GCM10030260]|uniref:hypothetical protein n=1 Tax=Dankookia sp. GCM10030260 TaxID=3273390 RepID=UPI00360CE7F5